MGNERRPGVGVGIIVVRDGCLLLVKRRHHGAGSWAAPGGYLDQGESFEACVERELLEEVGVRATDVCYLGIANDVHPDGKHNVTVWMSARLVGGEPRLVAANELAEVGWFPLAALPEPLYLSTENFVTGRTYPPDVRREAFGR
jgi:8-oxo-dGTP diphosphatase